MFWSDNSEIVALWLETYKWVVDEQITIAVPKVRAHSPRFKRI